MSVGNTNESLAEPREWLELRNLPIAEGAAFDSHEQEHNGYCLENTRVDIVDQILQWASKDNQRHIYWLNGMAGTGKTAIARSVAVSLQERGDLGGSFFFGKGQGSRGTASHFFSTLAVQLSRVIPEFYHHVAQAFTANEDILTKGLNQQYEVLLEEPLKALADEMRYVIVVDGLDECDRETDVLKLVRLLALGKTTSHLRWFIASRPELVVRVAFANIDARAYHAVVLEEITKATVEEDITVFIEEKLREAKERMIKRGKPCPEPYWPGPEAVRTLARQSSPLFIYAAILCQYIGDPRGNAYKRLQDCMTKSSDILLSRIEEFYMRALETVSSKLYDDLHPQNIETFRYLVGSIITLIEPLSLECLAALGIEDVDSTLDELHSVLQIPARTTSPIRLLHPSFRDFLTSFKTSLFIDQKTIHGILADRCLDALCAPGVLCENMCRSEGSTGQVTELRSELVSVYLPQSVAYACRYWVDHWQKSERDLTDWDSAHQFLTKHMLHWLEAMICLGAWNQWIDAIMLLISICEVKYYNIRKIRTLCLPI